MRQTLTAKPNGPGRLGECKKGTSDYMGWAKPDRLITAALPGTLRQNGMGLQQNGNMRFNNEREAQVGNLLQSRDTPPTSLVSRAREKKSWFGKRGIRAS